MNSIIERGLLSKETENNFDDINNLVNVTSPDKEGLSLVERGLVKPEPSDETINTVAEILKKSAEEKIAKLPEEVDDLTFFQAIENGWQESITGMLSRGSLPEKRLSDEASLFDVATSAVSSEVADIWVTLGSAKAGAAAGTAVAPGIGTAVGAFGGAVSIPSGIREAIVASMEKGEVTTWEDFADITKRAGTQALIGLGVGVTTLGAGKVAGGATQRFLNNKNINNLTKKGSKYLAEFLGQTTAMTTSMGVMKGEIPDSQDFVRSAVTMLAINGAERVVTLGGKGAIKATKETTKTIRDVYKKHGIKPSDLSKLIKADKTIHEDIVSDLSTPRALSDPEGLQEAARKVGESIVAKEPDVKVSIGETANTIYTKTLDSMHPIRVMMNSLAETGDTKTAANVYIKSTMQRTTPFNTANRFMNFDTIDFEGKKSKGKSYKTILDSVGKDTGLLETYMVSKRSLELASRGKKSGVDAKASKKVIKDIESSRPEIVKAAKDMNKFQDDVLTYYKDSGLISKDDYARIKKLNQDYVPFHRVYEDGLKAKSKGKNKSSANVLKGLTKEGSERQVVSPLRTIAKNTEAMVTMAEHNRYLKETIDWTLKQEGGQDFFEKSVKFKSTKVGKDDLPDNLKDIVSDDFELDVFRADKGVTDPNQIAIYRDGKKEVYTIKDPDLAEAFQSLQPHQMGAIMKVASTFTRFKRAGITNSLTFGVTNFLRAEMSSAVNSPDSYIPLYDGLKGLVDLSVALKSPDSRIGKTKYAQRMRGLYKDWMSAGGGRSTMIDIDDTYIKRGLDRYLKEGERNLLGRSPMENIAQVGKATTYIPRKFLQLLEDTSSFAENAPRFRQFQKSVEAGADPVRAAYESAEIATNFSKKGSSNIVNGLRQTSAFLGATAQSYDKMVRQLATRPRDTVMRSLTMLTVPSVTLHLTHHYQEDEDGNLVQADWYKKTPQYVKDLFWVINVGTEEDPVVMRFAKPYDYGLLFATSAENFVDFVVSEDPEAAKQFGKSLFDNLAPSIDLVSPDIITPFVEVAANHSVFKDAPIVPKSKENLLSSLQASSYSTQLSRELSQFLTEMVPSMEGSRFLSPAGIEHFVNSWTGTIGTTTLQGLDALLQEAGILKETPKTRANLADVGKKALSLIGITDPDPDTPVHLMDIPILKAFFVRDGLGAKEIDTFFKNKKQNAMFEKSLNFVKKNDPSMYEYVFNKIQENGGLVDIDSAEKPMMNALEMINRISQAPNDTISVKDKQNLLKPLTHSVYLYAESLNGRFKIQRRILEDTMKKKKEYDKMRSGE